MGLNRLGVLILLVSSFSGASTLAQVTFTDVFIGGESDIVNSGSLVSANNLGSGAVPTVLNGIAFGGGCEIAMGCHVRLAPKGARVLAAQPEVAPPIRRGLSILRRSISRATLIISAATITRSLISA